MKPERQNGKEALTVDQMVTSVGTIRAAVLAQLNDMTNSLDTTEYLEMLNQLSTRCARAFERFDGLVEKQNKGDEVRVNIFNLAYQIIKDVRDEVDDFLKMTPAERDEYIRQSQPIDLETAVTNDDTAPIDTPDNDTPAAAADASVADTTTTPAPHSADTVVDTAAVHSDPTTASAVVRAEAVDPALLKEEVERLKHADDAILYVDGNKENGFKRLAELRKDIETLFAADGQSNNSQQAFYLTKFKKLAGHIARERRLLKVATPEQRKEIRQSIDQAYHTIVVTAAAWLRNKKVYDEGAASDRVPDRGVAEIKGEIKEAEESFLILHEQHKSETGFTDLDSYKAAQAILDEIKNTPADSPDLSRELEVLLSKLGEALDKLFLEVAGEDDLGDILSEQDGPLAASASGSVDTDADAFLGGVEVKELDADTVDFLNGVETRELDPDADVARLFGLEAKLETSEKVKAQFKEFIANNKTRIDEELARGDGRTLAKIIYEDFYSASTVGLKYDESDSQYQVLAEYFNQEAEKLNSDIKALALAPGSVVRRFENNYWENAMVNDFLPGAKIGRLYLNTKPEAAHAVFSELLNASIEKNLDCQLKIPRRANVTDFNRADKIVFYFDSKEDAEVLAMVEDIYARFSTDFVGDTPKFTSEVPNSTGETMSGVGFGEEPIAERTSFGNIRSEILAYVVNAANHEGLSVDDPNFDFETVFAFACSTHGVDSKNPAFNALQNSADFTELKHRLGIEPIAPSGAATPDVLGVDPAAVTPDILGTDPGVVTPEPIPVPVSIGRIEMAERTEKRLDSLKAKEEFKAIKKQYFEALELHQQEANNRSLFEKLKSLGIKPELPEALKALETEYLVRRKDYAQELDARLSQRGEKFTLSKDDMKRAFARKFILRPQDELLKLQERNLLSPEASERFKNIMGQLAKHKWAIRALTVTAAGAIGAATGGTALAFAGAAGLKGVKIAASATAGAYAGGIANARAGEYVEKKQQELTQTKSKIEKDFSIDSMLSAGTTLAKAAEAEAKAKKFQKVVTVGAAGIAGFAAGNALAEDIPDSTEGIVRTPVAASQTVGSLDETTLANMRTSQISPQVVEDSVETVPSNSTTVAETLPPPKPFIQSIAMPFDSREGGLKYEHRIESISFGPEFKPAALSQLQTNELASFVKIKTDDFVAAHPNITEATLGKQLLEVVEKRYSNESWWSEAPIKTVDVNKLELVLVNDNGAAAVGTAATATEPVSETAPINRYQISSEHLRGEYVVKPGDTLWKIAETQFAEQLKDITDPAERRVIMGELFDRVRANPHLLESLSLESVNDIDKIKAGETIELSGLQSELAAVLEKKDVVELFQKSAPLPVEADTDVKTLPIKVVEKPVPAAITELMVNDKPYVESAPAKPVITPEITTSTKGYYEAAPEHVRAEIRQYFGSADNFSAAVENAADKISNRGYNFLEIFSKAYESPYNQFREMTMEQFRTEIQSMPPKDLDAYLNKHHFQAQAFEEWINEIKRLEGERLQNGTPVAKTETIGAMFEQSVLKARIDEKLNNSLYRN